MDILSFEREGIDIDKIFSKLELFDWSEKSVKQFFKKNLELVQLDSHEILMNQGDEPDYFYIVHTGRLIAHTREGVILGYINAGQVIGEMSLIADKPRSASIHAIRQSLLLRISNRQLREFMLKHPGFTIKLSKILFSRMEFMIASSYRTQIVRATNHTVAIISAGNKSIVDEFIKAFFPTVSQYKRTLELRQTMFKGQAAENQSNDPSGSQWLNSASRTLSKFESEYDLLFFNGGFEDNDWGKFTIQNADTILLVADASSRIQLNYLEHYLFANETLFKNVQKCLVMVHASSMELPKAVSTWRQGRSISSIHNVCLHEASTLNRFARILTNNTIGLVLSGGGSNGYAHIGVIKAMTEYGITIDAIGGVSAGAIMAALYAMGKNSDELLETIKKLRSKLRKRGWFISIPLMLLQFPFSSIINPRQIEQIYSHLFKDVEIEDLWVNFFSLACNLTTRKDAIFERGSLVDAVLATNALPGLFSPQLIKGELYIDGSASNSMPGDVMKKKYPNIVIGSSVARHRGIQIAPQLQHFPSSREILYTRLNPYEKQYKVPLFPEIINASLVIGNKRKLAEVYNIIDLVIEPDLSQFGPQQHEKMDQIIEAGYKEACIQLEKWVKIAQNKAI